MIQKIQDKLSPKTKFNPSLAQNKPNENQNRQVNPDCYLDTTEKPYKLNLRAKNYEM